jgi:hypothetical protein
LKEDAITVATPAGTCPKVSSARHTLNILTTRLVMNPWSAPNYYNVRRPVAESSRSALDSNCPRRARSTVLGSQEQDQAGQCQRESAWLGDGD